ncbi:hypothetical protein SI65_09383 [Aspergillus cristatus]|uniref:Uncharacterized protein n=1 Tax=Aspergillus cristatus TaxID=573508 RepID=A0A1E3B2J8_ASPCR|nr:hypothetical protein SI65_09383 [Aspergillus cristatus]
MKKDLDRMKLKSDAEVLERQEAINKKNDELTMLANELEKYDQAVKDAKAKRNQNSDEIKAKESKRDDAQRQLDTKVREMRNEYERKVEEQRQKQAEWELEKKRLEDEKETSWGNALRKGKEVERSWRWWQDQVNQAYAWKEQAWRIHCDAGFFDKFPTWLKFQEANAGLEQIKARRDAQNEILKLAREIVSSPAFRKIEYGINDAVREINNGYIQEMSRDERAELDRQIRQLNELREKSKELEANLRMAIDALEKSKGRITNQEREVQTRILTLEKEIELKPFEDAYRNKKNDHDTVAAQVQVIQQTLKDIGNGVNAETKAAKQVVEALKKATPRITLIVVKASTGQHRGIRQE